MEREAKRIRLNGQEGSGFSEERQARAEELLEAARSDPSRAQQLVEQGADAWYQDDVGWTCLHHAASAGFTELVRYLLSHGAVWNMTDASGLTAGDVAFSLNDAETYDVLVQEGMRAEMLVALLDQDDEEVSDAKESASDLDTFLKTRLRFEGAEGQERCLDADGNGVMMAWEGDIMQRTASLLCQGQECDFACLNVGFGLGLIDTALQSYSPSKHLIIEAHPDVHAYMRSKGWYSKEGVEIFEGTWQQYLKAIETGERDGAVFDVVYWDTFSEHYADLRTFFEELPGLLKEETSRFSFFNGLGATSRCFYDVSTSVAEMHLREIGLSTSWADVEVADGGEVTWAGVTRRYWQVPSPYRLPLCKLEMP